ncbi:secretion protein HlyD [Salinisphaera hydrothermalis]|uniref:Efflux pump membrane fusion protein n=1 Tax=Salinisphaera hydrothermalis (strain C41B8) TaxID=1304275 RepID=A0A084IKS2_SALHC|nr:secretion protein HlyD [Salinisphaera hydrothermalis]KEZ77306.1 efflux pump membrane fusion protein [Salinisphaera hydrothermalis C41B8]
MNHRRSAIAAAVLLATAVVAGLASWWDRDRGPTGLRLYGNVDIRQVELAFRQPGRLTSVAVEEGDRVHAGQWVAAIDAAPYRQALAQAAAQVRADAAVLTKLEAGNRPQEIAEAKAAVERAQATYRNAERDYRRERLMRASNAAAQRSLDAARAARDQAAAELASAEQALSLQRAGARSEDIATARATLAAARAQRDQARIALGDTRLYAPAAATVLSRVREPGSMVGPSEPVLTLNLRNPVYVRAYVDEPDLGRIVPGATVTLHTDSSKRVYHGRIGFIASQAEFTPKSVETPQLRTDLVYRLRIVVSDADEGLRQGMPVTVDVAEPRS